jgi:predicted enzyme related to lactoylglutathione lyase
MHGTPVMFPAGGELDAVKTSVRPAVTPCVHNELVADLITKLLPILHVSDPAEERRFYEQLGLRTTYEGPEYPDFIAVGNDVVEFGLSRRPGASPEASGVTWQLGVSDIDEAIAACQQAGLNFEVIAERPREDWTYRVLKVRSPSGMEVLLEEQAPQA